MNARGRGTKMQLKMWNNFYCKYFFVLCCSANRASMQIIDKCKSMKYLSVLNRIFNACCCILCLYIFNFTCVHNFRHACTRNLQWINLSNPHAECINNTWNTLIQLSANQFSTMVEKLLAYYGCMVNGRCQGVEQIEIFNFLAR